MKHLLNGIRWIVGLLFIFSGLIKANDPLGLSYKMQEFFEAWGLPLSLNQYTLALSVLMNAFEIIAGIALLIGWRMRLLSWSLLGLTVFFTFLTGYASLATNPDGSMKFRSCGCFGDCIPLDPFQSFLKDLVLLALILILLVYRNKIKQIFSNIISTFIIVVAIVFSFGSQWYTLKYLPVVDCLPFKKGNDLLVLRQIPPNAIPDSFDIKFIYSKDGVDKEFSVTSLPDSTWDFKERKQVLVRKGKNNEPLIKDFNIKNESGMDITENILGSEGAHYLLFIQSAEALKKEDKWREGLQSILSRSGKVRILTAVPDEVGKLLNEKSLSGKVEVFSCDVTAIKTASRAIPVLYRMNGSVVEEKWSGASASSWQ
jgi:uncharacterized membrane protein YphA (DoxX/SURF4 family)